MALVLYFIMIVFPVYLYSYVKRIKLDSNCFDFCETVSVILVKRTLLVIVYLLLLIV